MKRIHLNLTFKKKRDYKLITPCCNKTNKGGKFVNYNELPNRFGYCHSCAKTTLPPPIYENEKFDRFTFNQRLNKYEPLNFTPIVSKPLITKPKQTVCSFIKEDEIWKYYNSEVSNNLINFLLKNYDHEKVWKAIYEYVIGTSSNGGTVFWEINKNLKVQRCKIFYFNIHGRRSKYFKIPYTKENGFHSCLFGSHLLIDSCKKKQTIMLVESEKTALVGSIVLPKYTWLAYGGENMLKPEYYPSLIGYKVIISPDLEERAIQTINNKIPEMRKIGVDARLFLPVDTKTDEELKKMGVRKKDLEDFFREMPNG